MKTQEKTLLKLVDGDIVTFAEDDKYHYDGCETCDWGSSYVQNFSIVTTKGTLHMNTSQMYEYVVAHDFLMKLLLPNVDEIRSKTIDEFVEWFKTETDKHTMDNHARNYRDRKVNFKWVPAVDKKRKK